MNYYKFSFQTAADKADILLAFLGELAFESFTETETGLEAFVPEKEVENITTASLETIQSIVPFVYSKTFIPYQNWNAVWESNFQAIRVGDFCGIRADFHPPFEGVRFDLLINPKMAFGTGHHETTFMMMETMEGLDFQNKKVLDYGCGTGILAILASKLGANPIHGVDIEEPSYLNTIENSELNDVHNVQSIHGTLEDITDTEYDVILANINRHVILATLGDLYNKLHSDGTILFSGILKEDEDVLKNAFLEHQFCLVEQKQRGNWLCLVVRK